MEEGFGSGLILLMVGMGTAFMGLALVVLFGNWLILLTNKFAPAGIEPTTAAVKAPEPVTLPTQPAPVSDVSPKQLAAILAAVEVATEGKGYVEKVTRQHG